MTETPLMNDDAARSTTGEILDQSTVTPPTTSTTSTPEPPADDKAPPTDPAKSPAPDAAKPPAAPDAYTDFKAPESMATRTIVVSRTAGIDLVNFLLNNHEAHDFIQLLLNVLLK